jgi:putative restriction endonuclease
MLRGMVSHVLPPGHDVGGSAGGTERLRTVGAPWQHATMVVPREHAEVSCGCRRLPSLTCLCQALGRAAPSWLEVLDAINVRVAAGRILVPDLVVVTNPGLDLTVWDPAEVTMVVEIVSPGSIAADRAIKPQLYSAAGIEHYLRIELSSPSPSSVAYRLQRGHYVQVASSRPGQVLGLTEPFPVDLDLAELTAATRPPQ